MCTRSSKTRARLQLLRYFLDIHTVDGRLSERREVSHDCEHHVFLVLLKASTQATFYVNVNNVCADEE